MKQKNFYPLVTIYITNFNYGLYLNESIKSVLNQTYQNYELIIIDDGSTDNSKKVIEKFRHLKNVKIIFQKNKGLNFANNIALKLSKGKYITRLDADDWLDENFLQVMVSNLKKDPKIGMIFCNYYLVDKNGSIIDQFLRHDFKKVKLLDQPAHGACSLINTECLKLIGGYDKNFRSQDGVDVWIRLIQKYKIKNINLPLFYYRQHGKNLTSNKKKLFKSRDQILKKNSYNKKIHNTICIIPIRGMNEDTVALKKIKGKIILYRIIDELKKTNHIKNIIVSSPDEKIIKMIKKKYKKKVITFKRKQMLARYNTPIIKTLVDTTKRLSKKIIFDSILKLNVDHPLLNVQNYESAINIMNIFDTDEVITVKKENDGFYYHNGKGMMPFKNSTNLTLEREEVYRKIGSMHLIRKNCLLNYTKPKKTGHLIVDEISAHRIKNEQDLKISEILIKK